MHSVEFEAHARKEFLALPKDIQQSLIPSIDLLRENPRPFGCKKLKGVSGYRIRKGDYRILYTISDKEKTVRIYRIRKRQDVYK